MFGFLMCAVHSVITGCFTNIILPYALRQEMESKRRKWYGPLSKAIARKLHDELHRITESQSLDYSAPALSASDRVLSENGNTRPDRISPKDSDDSASDSVNAFGDDEVMNRMEMENAQNVGNSRGTQWSESPDFYQQWLSTDCIGYVPWRWIPFFVKMHCRMEMHIVFIIL